MAILFRKIFLSFVLFLFSTTFALNAKFLNVAPYPMYLFWEGHTGSNAKPKIMASLKADGGMTSFQTYAGHNFFFSKTEENPMSTKKFAIKENQLIYTYATKGSNPELITELKKERRFMKQYHKRTGRKWLASWPRPTPVFHIWNASYIGQEFYVPLDDAARHFNCEGTNDECQTGERDYLLVRAVALKPRAYVVDNFLSDFESAHIIAISEPRMTRSTTGSGENARVDPVRTSKSSWIRRDESHIFDAIYHRLANIVNMPSESVTHSHASERMNILRYEGGQEYTPHYDWGANGSDESRFISALIYMQSPEEGGETSFPMSPLPDGKKGVKVTAKQNTMTFFYDLLEDGNVDEFSLHAGEPVTKGVKWCAPMWLWDPHLTNGKSSETLIEEYKEEYHRRLQVAAEWETESPRVMDKDEL